MMAGSTMGQPSFGFEDQVPELPLVVVGPDELTLLAAGT